MHNWKRLNYIEIIVGDAEISRKRLERQPPGRNENENLISWKGETLAAPFMLRFYFSLNGRAKLNEEIMGRIESDSFFVSSVSRRIIKDMTMQIHMEDGSRRKLCMRRKDKSDELTSISCREVKGF